MSPEERELLEKSVELAEENNEILRSIRRSMRLGRIMSIVYWVIIIGTAIGAFYVVEPYFKQLFSIYSDAKDQVDSLGGVLNNLNQFK